MHAPRFTYTISRELLPLVRAGKLVLNARASRLTWPDGRFAAPLIPGRGLTMELTRAPVGATLEALKQALRDSEFRDAGLEQNLTALQRGYDETEVHRIERAQKPGDASTAIGPLLGSITIPGK